jgi:hypothetical protein
MSSQPKESCVNCHFFVENHAAADRVHPLEVNKEKRDKSEANDFSWLTRISTPDCSRLVWSEGVGTISVSDRHRPALATGQRLRAAGSFGS